MLGCGHTEKGMRSAARCKGCNSGSATGGSHSQLASCFEQMGLQFGELLDMPPCSKQGFLQGGCCWNTIPHNTWRQATLKHSHPLATARQNGLNGVNVASYILTLVAGEVPSAPKMHLGGALLYDTSMLGIIQKQFPPSNGMTHSETSST